MAYLYKKPNSPFWYAQYYDAKGKKCDHSTKLRHDDPNESLQAEKLLLDLKKEELVNRSQRSLKTNKDTMPIQMGWTWVEKYFKRHCKTESTHERYLDAWKWLALWLRNMRIYSPRHLRYKQAVDYVDWRVKAKKKSGKSAGRNTAIYELKILSMVMDEAVRMEEAEANPLSSLDIAKDESKEKPEITEPELRKILQALPGEPEWMQLSFQIALSTGCRLRDTRLHVVNIDLERNTLMYGKPKGGRKRAYTVPMPKRLKPLLADLKAKHEGYIFEFPFQPSRRWRTFFDKMGMPHIVFHCTRVTFITRQHRAGVPEEIVKRLVNHANSLIHQIYVRKKVEDLKPWAGKVEEAMDTIFQELPEASLQPQSVTPSPGD